MPTPEVARRLSSSARSARFFAPTRTTPASPLPRAAGIGGLIAALALVSSCTASTESDVSSATTVPAVSVSESTAGSGSESAASPSSSSAPASTGGVVDGSSYEAAPCPNPILAPYSQFDLSSGFECGYLTVPQSRSKPDGKTLKLAVARIKATSPTPRADPLLYLAGGPGGTGLLAANERVAEGWNRDQDVVFLDQRGTLKSEPLLACPEIDAFLATAVTLNTLDPGTANLSGSATRACYNRLVTEGWDPAAFNTTENAADIADLRVALGIDRWNLYGVSYGTDLAAQTLRDHPVGIRSVVLDSVVPANVNLMDSFWPSAASGYDAMFAACAAQPACAAAYPDLEVDLDSVVNELAVAPRTVTVPDPVTQQPVAVVIDGYKIANLAVVASLQPGAIAPVPAMIDNLAHGDGTLAAEELLRQRPPSGVTGYGLALGVFCAEGVAGTDTDTVVNRARAVLPTFPNAVLEHLPQASWLLTDCRQWPVPAAAAAVAAPVRSNVPVLVLDGALDAITAPANGGVVARDLPNATRVLFPDSAHDVLKWSAPCAVSVMQSFLADPAAPDTACAATLAPAAFAVK